MSEEQPKNPFPPELKQAFLGYITEDGYTNRERVSQARIIRYSAFLENPDLKPSNQADSTMKFEARNSYELIDKKLHRKPDETHLQPRYVVPRNEACDIIVKKHLQLAHPGRNKLYYAIDQQYYGIKRDECHWVEEHCLTCMHNSANRVKAPFNFITIHQTFERVQADLIDMRQEPSGRYSWVLHITDHYSKYTQLYALQYNHAESVAECVAQFIMASVPVKILQCG